MIRIGSALIVLAAIFWFFGYAALFFESFIMWIIAVIIGIIGGIILFVGVYRDRLKEKMEDDKNDYSKY